MSKKVNWVCPECNGDNIHVQSWSYWDKEKQVFEHSGLIDSYDWCLDCECEIRAEELELES